MMFCVKEYGWTIEEAFSQNYEDLCRLIINAEDEQKNEKQEKLITGGDILKYL